MNNTISDKHHKEPAGGFPLLTGCSFNLFHAPFFTGNYGSTIAAEQHKNPGSSFLEQVMGALRSYEQVCAYLPNQVFIGNLDPRELPQRPWYNREGSPKINGPFGDIVDERTLYGLIRHSDVFDLVKLERNFSLECGTWLGENPVTTALDLSCFSKGVDLCEVEQAVESGGVALIWMGVLVVSVSGAHPSDVNLNAHTVFENLTSKATAVYAVAHMLHHEKIDPASVDYIIETSEEACGDINQRGGGNFAKAIGELTGLVKATGSDIRSFCAAPMHGIVQAASLVKAGTFRRVIVTAGGSTAKLAMNAKKHMEKGLPIMEDCLGSFAVLIERENRNGRGVVLRTDAVGTHKIGSGSSPQAVVGDLVAEPVYKAGYRLSDIDYYAPELQNPEITEQAGAGNVTESNLKMIAAMAVMKQEIARTDIAGFTAAHGSAGWAPTQGHIPSGVPAFGWILNWAAEGSLERALVIGKGSLFLGRMTSLFDGISMLVEREHAQILEDVSSKVKIGLTLVGSEGGIDELKKGADLAMASDEELEVVFFGDDGGSGDSVHREMEQSLRSKKIASSVTFHYPFPIKIATVGHCKAPGNGRDLFLATTTGTSAVSRVEALVRNVISGIATAKAYGIAEPEIGILNSDGAALARKIVLRLKENGYPCTLAKSVRGDDLLRGNDILAGSVDVVVCDSLTGNVITKLLASYSTSGRIEEYGSGYGPGIGDTDNLVCIVSRASGAPVIRDALLLAKRMACNNVLSIYAHELEMALKAGLDELLGEHAGGSGPVSQQQAKTGVTVEKKVTDSEIEGLDVLSIEDAVASVMNEGIYCTAGMGCTGPVIMVASNDKQNAQEILRKNGYL